MIDVASGKELAKWSLPRARGNFPMTFDAASAEHAGSFFDAHRRAVNALAEHWKVLGWSHPGVVAIHAKETASPIDIDRGFPAKACVLPAPAEARTQRSEQSR